MKIHPAKLAVHKSGKWKEYSHMISVFDLFGHGAGTECVQVHFHFSQAPQD